jgi:hypothetical protein
MKRNYHLLLVVPLLFGLAGCSNTFNSSEYYPLAVGTTWHYKMGFQTLTVRVAKHESVDNVMCAVVETQAAGNTVREHISVRSDGLYRHTMAGQKADPPVRFLKLPVNIGETWRVTSSIAGQNLDVNYTVGQQEVRVPAGTYQTIYTQTSPFKQNGQTITAKIYYAKGVGMVKTEMTINGTRMDIELEKFEPAK